MSLRQIEESDIEATLREFDRLGRTAFLEQYGHRAAPTHVLRHNGRFYDPKAVVGVAARTMFKETALEPSEFEVTEAFGRLGKLGYEVLPFNGIWWVNQGASHQVARDGGFVWAPKHDKRGRPVAHHTNVNKLRVGQRIIHYMDNHIRAIGTVAEAPYVTPEPEGLGRVAWSSDGYFCPVDYRELVRPIHRDQIPDRLKVDEGPFDVKGNVKFGYMFPVPSDYEFTLLQFLDRQVPDLFGNRITHRHYGSAWAYRSSADASIPEVSRPIGT
jgi:hypothetical protein